MKIAFTGHRPKSITAYDTIENKQVSCGYSHDNYAEFVCKLSEYLASMYNGENITFISGGAQGFDQLAFWAVDMMRNNLPDKDRDKIHNEVYVPFVGQDALWAENGLFGKKEYITMLKKATHVKTLLPEKPDSQHVISALMSRNHAMVDASDIVIALYNEDNWFDPATKSGTAECMRYACAHGKTTLQIKYTIEGYVLKFDETSVIRHAPATE